MQKAECPASGSQSDWRTRDELEISGAKVKAEDSPGCQLGSEAFILQMVSRDQRGSVHVADLIELLP